jgi:DNA polymerase III delta prime subunit
VLVLIGGPTGVGKTTLIEALAAEGCGVVHTLTTRPPRPGDRFKTSVSPEAYREAAGTLYWPAQYLYGHFYGEDYAAVMAATCPLNARVWLIDAAPETIVIFDHVPHVRLILMPADGDTLLARTLAAANRLERLEKAREETVLWRGIADAARRDRQAATGIACTVEVPCRWGQQSEIVEVSRAQISTWQAHRAASSSL